LDRAGPKEKSDRGERLRVHETRWLLRVPFRDFCERTKGALFGRKQKIFETEKRVLTANALVTIYHAAMPRRIGGRGIDNRPKADRLLADLIAIFEN
jgi:hypothetical protein